MAFDENRSVVDDEASTRTAVLNSSMMADAFLTDGQSQCGTEGGPEASSCVSSSEVHKPQPRRDGRRKPKTLLVGSNDDSDEVSAASPTLLNVVGNQASTSDIVSHCQTESAPLAKDGDDLSTERRVKRKKTVIRKRMVKLSALGLGGGEESTACTSDTFDLPVPRIIYIFQKPKLKKRNRLQRLTNSMRLKLRLGSRKRLDPDDPEVHSKTLVDL